MIIWMSCFVTEHKLGLEVNSFSFMFFVSNLSFSFKWFFYSAGLNTCSTFLFRKRLRWHLTTWQLLLVVSWELHYKLLSGDLGFNICRICRMRIHIPVCRMYRMRTVLHCFAKDLAQRFRNTNICGFLV